MNRIDGIVYKSSCGHTKRYAEMLSDITGVPAYNVREALRELPKGGDIIFMGWIRARVYMGYSIFIKRFKVRAACVVGAIESGDRLTGDVRRRNRISEDIPVFYLRGGYDRDIIRGADSRLAGALIEELAKKRRKYEKKDQPIPIEEDELLMTLVKGGDYVSKERLSPLMTWYDDFCKTKG